MRLDQWRIHHIQGRSWKVLVEYHIIFADYNYAILKNDEFKKIILALPGISDISVHDRVDEFFRWS